MSANVNEACIAHRVANEEGASLPIKVQTWEPGIFDGHTDEIGADAEVKVVVPWDADEIGNGVLGFLGRSLRSRLACRLVRVYAK